MFDRIRKALAVALVALVSAFGVIAVQSPAQASWSDCAAYNNVVCFHQHANFTGQVWRQLTGQFPTGCRNFSPEGFENKASTAFNRTTNYTLRLWTLPGCTGSNVYLAPGDVQAFNVENTWMNDKASSASIQYVG